MKFKLKLVSYFYRYNDPRVDELRKLGFDLKRYEDFYNRKDEFYEFFVDNRETEIEFNTLEEFIGFLIKWDETSVFTNIEGGITVEIY